MKKLIVFFIFVIIFSSFSFAKDASSVFDKANILSNTENIQKEIDNIKKEYNALIVVYTIENSEDDDLLNYMRKIAYDLRLDKDGNPELNVLIIYFKKEKEVIVATRVNGFISNKLKKPIYQQLAKDIENGKFDEGFLMAVKNLNNAIKLSKKNFLENFKNIFKSNEEEKLIKKYNSENKIDTFLLIEAFLRKEYDNYNGKNKPNNFNDFKKKRKKLIDELKIKGYNNVKVNQLIDFKNVIYNILGISTYNKDYSNLLDAFYEKKIQCTSGTRLFVTSALEILSEEELDNLLVIGTSGHVLAGMIKDERLIGFETTKKGQKLYDFGNVNLETKKLENFPEKLITVKARYILFSDLVSDSELSQELFEEGIVINNPGKVTSVGNGGGGSGTLSLLSFGMVDVFKGDTTMQTDNKNGYESFRTSSNVYSGFEGKSESGSDSKNYEQNVDSNNLVRYMLGDVNTIQSKKINGVITLIIPDKEGKPNQEFFKYNARALDSDSDDVLDTLVIYYCNLKIKDESGQVLIKYDIYKNKKYTKSEIQWGDLSGYSSIKDLNINALKLWEKWNIQ
ncbi:MAG: TPM domain-containing protein [Nanoarchaeota archaeon]